MYLWTTQSVMPCCQGQDVFENVGRRGAGGLVDDVMMAALIDKRRHEVHRAPPS